MSDNTSRPLLRRRAAWAVPALTVAVVAGAVSLSSHASASAHPRLPARTAAQLLAAVQTSDATALSGTIVETARLGLPALPGADSASLSWQSLATGSHTAQVWIAGPDKQRVAVKGSLTESDVIHNQRDLWTYTSATNEVSHTVLTDSGGRSSARNTPDVRSYTPAQAAQQALKAIDPTTRVSVDRTRMVAGHKAYTLVLVPRDTRSTVTKVTIALDSVHFVPVQVQVFGSAAAPAFETGFTTNLSFATPKASVFDFHAPAGAKVVQNPLTRHPDGGSDSAGPSSLPDKQGLRGLGTGWTSIAELTHGLPAAATGSMLDKLTKPVGSTGNRLLSTSLVNVLVMADGRVFLGAVTPALLEQTAATHR